jgi:hypothetical protein
MGSKLFPKHTLHSILSKSLLMLFHLPRMYTPNFSLSLMSGTFFYLSISYNARNSVLHVINADLVQKKPLRTKSSEKASQEKCDI